MSVIKLAESKFQTLPEGNTTLQVTDVEYNEKFGKLILKCKSANNIIHQERFNFLTANGTVNEKTLNAFSFVARNIYGDMSLAEIDPSALIGKYFNCTVEHTTQPNVNDPTKTVTFVHVKNITHADGFETSGEVAPKESKVSSNLLDILG